MIAKYLKHYLPRSVSSAAMFFIALASTGVLYYIWIYAPYIPYADQIVIRNRVVARHLEIPILRKKEILFDLDTGEIKVDTIANRIHNAIFQEERPVLIVLDGMDVDRKWFQNRPPNARSMTVFACDPSGHRIGPIQTIPIWGFPYVTQDLSLIVFEHKTAYLVDLMGTGEILSQTTRLREDSKYEEYPESVWSVNEFASNKLLVYSANDAQSSGFSEIYTLKNRELTCNNAWAVSSTPRNPVGIFRNYIISLSSDSMYFEYRRQEDGSLAKIIPVPISTSGLDYAPYYITNIGLINFYYDRKSGSRNFDALDLREIPSPLKIPVREDGMRSPEDWQFLYWDHDRGIAWFKYQSELLRLEYATNKIISRGRAGFRIGNADYIPAVDSLMIHDEKAGLRWEYFDLATGKKLASMDPLKWRNTWVILSSFTLVWILYCAFTHFEQSFRARVHLKTNAPSFNDGPPER